MDKFGVITLVLVVLIFSTLLYYILVKIVGKRHADKVYKISIQRQINEIESRKNKIRIMGNNCTEFDKTEFAQTEFDKTKFGKSEFVESKHAKKH